MEITELRLSLRDNAERRLRAYVTLTFDHCFVVRNIKIIDGRNGLFVAMPSHKPKLACGRCQFKNEVGGRFCSQCGGSLSRPMERPSGLGDLESPESQSHRDIAHPITAAFRQYLQQKVLEAYEAERAKGPPSSSPPLDVNDDPSRR